MKIITAYNPNIIRVATAYNKNHHGMTLDEMLSAISITGECVEQDLLQDKILIRGAKKLGVNGLDGTIPYVFYVQLVAQAQRYLLRKENEMKLLRLSILKNFKAEDTKVVLKNITDIGDSLGSKEVRFYNFFIDLFNDVYKLKKREELKQSTDGIDSRQRLELGFLNDFSCPRDYVDSFDFLEAFKNGHIGFTLKREHRDIVLSIISWVVDGPANNIEEPSYA